MRRMQQLLLVLVAAFCAVAALVAGAGPAGAHAVVVSSSPSADERLPDAPAEVSIAFSEAFTSDLGGLTVLDSDGDRVDNDDSTQPTPDTLRTSLRPGLEDGTYVANYKIVSADGHPISGAVVFGIGDAQLGDISDLAATNDPAAERIASLARFLTYTAALLVAGLAYFVSFVHDGASDRRPMTHLVQAATIIAAIGAVLTIAAQASLATGDGVGAIAQVDVLRGVLREGMGWSTAVLFVGLALCHLAVTTRPSALAQGLTFYGALAITTSFVFWGHAREAPNMWLAVAADIIHVAVAAAWFGGLVGLTIILRARTRSAQSAGLAQPTLLTDTDTDTRNTRPTSAPSSSGEDDDPVIPSAAPGGMRSATALLDRPKGEGEGRGGDEGLTSSSGSTADDAGRIADDAAPPGSLEATVGVVQRFSTTAAVSVVVLTLSGVALSWQEVGSIDALVSTSYGQTLLVKLAIVAVILALAAYNRFLLLPWLLASTADDAHLVLADSTTDGDEIPAADTPGQGGPDDGPTGSVSGASAHVGSESELTRGWRTLLRTVVAEALAIVAVLAVTAVLVNVVPGRTDTGSTTGPYRETQPFRDGTIALTITPNQPGVNSVHVDFLGPDGRPADLAQRVILELRLPDKGLGPLEREMLKGGVGHFFLEGISDLSIAGTWEITLNVRVSDFDQERVTFTDPIG